MRAALFISALAGLAVAAPRPQDMDFDEIMVSQPTRQDYSIELTKYTE